eukprot:753875-Hanusia_phi.AAC.6
MPTSLTLAGRKLSSRLDNEKAMKKKDIVSEDTCVLKVLRERGDHDEQEKLLPKKVKRRWSDACRLQKVVVMGLGNLSTAMSSSRTSRSTESRKRKSYEGRYDFLESHQIVRKFLFLPRAIQVDLKVGKPKLQLPAHNSQQNNRSDEKQSGISHSHRSVSIFVALVVAVAVEANADSDADADVVVGFSGPFHVK